MGVKLDYVRAKAEADLHRYLESGHQNVPDALRAAVCYLKTLTPGLISEYLKPDLQFPSTAVEDFRSACTDAEEYLWEYHFRSVEFLCECDFSQTDFMTGIYAELSQLQNRAVTDFWSARAEYLAKLGGEPPPSAVSAGADNKPSDGLTRADAQTPDSAAASDSSKFEFPGGAAPTSVATPGNVADRNGCERIPGTAALSLADRTEIEQQLQQWRNGISVDISLLLSWSGELAVTTPPESMEYFQELQPNLRSESFLRLSFDWEGSGREILNHDQITATLLNNLQKALRRYGQRAIDLISSKWADKGLHPSTFASRMESAGEALEQDVFQMLGDGVSALAHGASTESLEQALSGNVKTRIAREIELYRRNAQLVGLCELPERNDVAAEYRAADESVSPLLEGVSTPPLPAREQTDTARADKGALRPDFPRRSAEKIRATINGADTLLTQGIKRLPTELQDGKRTKQEVEEILCQKSKEWAWDVFVTILREWAEIGIPPDDFEAIAKGQIESLSTRAEERVATFVSTFQLSSGEVLRCVREFLPCLIPPYREENRFRFHSVRMVGKAVLPPQSATPRAGGPATPAEAQEQSQEAERTVDSTDRSAAKVEAVFPARASWLKDRLLERGWSNSDPSGHEGPDRKTVQKILRGEAVRNDVLQKLADALSQRYGKVNVLDIPQD
jgi:hypothetical protein